MQKLRHSARAREIERHRDRERTADTRRHKQADRESDTDTKTDRQTDKQSIFMREILMLFFNYKLFFSLNKMDRILLRQPYSHYARLILAISDVTRAQTAFSLDWFVLCPLNISRWCQLIVRNCKLCS